MCGRKSGSDLYYLDQNPEHFMDISGLPDEWYQPGINPVEIVYTDALGTRSAATTVADNRFH
jgi:hypothetical protein